LGINRDLAGRKRKMKTNSEPSEIRSEKSEGKSEREIRKKGGE